jgi:hypothetical protein
VAAGREGRVGDGGGWYGSVVSETEADSEGLGAGDVALNGRDVLNEVAGVSLESAVTADTTSVSSLPVDRDGGRYAEHVLV